MTSRYLAAFTAVFSIPVLAANPLAEEPSAYLRSFADSPVRWTTWGEAAFARAREENKPVFLHIGTFTSELSRAMRAQSFAREENAALLNEHFVCVLVDREERPDLAALYQTYLRVVKQSQGWPLNLWLTPELKPFDGGSYLPPSDEWGKEGFPNALKRVQAAWQADPEAQQHKAGEAAAALAEGLAQAPGAYDDAGFGDLLAEGAQAWQSTFDTSHGGFGDPPKFPEPELLRFLLRTDDASRDAALATLRAIAASPLRDPLDGGFFRYASDAAWQLPYLQKSLADQARLALAYLDAAKVSGDKTYATVARNALRYALSLGDPQNGYAAAEDGTPENIAPAFFWTFDEIRRALGAGDAELFGRLTGATAAGNLEADAYLGIETAGKNVLASPDLATDEKSAARFAAAAVKLRQSRAGRAAPLRADSATAGAHGLLLTALSRAGTEFPDPELTSAAAALATYVGDQLHAADGKLLAIAGRPAAASARDHAIVIEGLLTFAAGSGDSAARERALALHAYMQENLADAKSGRYFAIAEPLPAGVWARVHAPAPETGDGPGAETGMLQVLTIHELGEAETRATLAAAIATEINDAPTVARGDQLFALQEFALKR